MLIAQITEKEIVIIDPPSGLYVKITVLKNNGIRQYIKSCNKSTFDKLQKQYDFQHISKGLKAKLNISYRLQYSIPMFLINLPDLLMMYEKTKNNS